MREDEREKGKVWLQDEFVWGVAARWDVNLRLQH
jgi:hypothetical protein